MTDNGNIRKILQDHERRIKKLETIKPFQNKKTSKKPSVLNLLIELREEGFFDKPKLLKEIVNELARLGYHYRPTSLSETMKRAVRKKILGRVGSTGKWQYVRR